jgi:hypothetical protein
VTAPAGSCSVGAACPADINGSGIVDASDLTQLLAAWGSDLGTADIDGNGTVDGLDLSAVLAAWGPCN